MDIEEELAWMRDAASDLCRSGALTCRFEIQFSDRWLVVKGHRWPSTAHTVAWGDAATLEEAEEIADRSLAAEILRQKGAAERGRRQRAGVGQA